MVCNKCKKEIRDTALFCPYCGTKVNATMHPNEKNSGSRKVVIIVALIVVLLILLGFSLYFFILMPKHTDNKSTKNNTSSSIATVQGNNTTSKSQEQMDIDYSVSKLVEAIHAAENCYNYGGPCDICDDFVYGEAWEYLTESQQEKVVDLVSCKCCHSISDAREHFNRYFSGELLDAFSEESYVEYRGYLYYALAGHEMLQFDTNITSKDVVRKSSDEISITVTVNELGHEDHFMFDFKYIDGSYKVIDITDV